MFIKDVAQSLLTYCMSILRLLNHICNYLSTLITQFWCSKSNSTLGISWIWKKVLVRVKAQGGLGFRVLCLFNFVLLAK